MSELENVLKILGFPVAYRHFKSPPTVPYIVYLLDSTDNMGADNKVYAKANNILIELYTDFKDEETERLLEDLLDENEIFYNKNENYIKEEDLFQASYSVALGGN